MMPCQNVTPAGLNFAGDVSTARCNAAASADCKWEEVGYPYPMMILNRACPTGTWVMILPALLLAVALSTGCSSTPKVDWNSRIGVYSYDQAVLEMGPPDRATQLSDGSTVAEWFVRRGSAVSVGMGTGFYGSRGGMSVGQTVSPGRSGVFLRLTFDPEGRLRDWARVRR